MTDTPILIVMRLAEMRRVHPRMITARCDKCHEAVGIYPSGQGVLARAPQTLVLCSVCHTPSPHATMAPGAEVEPSESVWRK
jgi:hypothetical protein